MPEQPKAAVQKMWTTSFYTFHWPKHTDEAPGMIKYIYQLRDQQSVSVASRIAPGAKSGAGLFESEFDLLEHSYSGLQNLKAFACECVRQTVSHVNGAKVPPSRLTVEICDSWYHITNSGGFHDAHAHGGCSWCGIYYLQIGDSGRRVDGGAPNGGNRFYSPHLIGGMQRDYGNEYLTHTYVDPPLSDGMLLLFPSYLLHSGLPYEGEKDRIVISFNSRTLAT